MSFGRELSAVGVAESASHPGPAMLWPFAPNAPTEVAELVAPLPLEMIVPVPREPMVPGMVPCSAPPGVTKLVPSGPPVPQLLLSLPLPVFGA